MGNDITNINTGGGTLHMVGSAIGSSNRITTHDISTELESSGQAELKTLLLQLKQAIESDMDLSHEDKEDLLEQVRVLEDGEQNEDVKKIGLARKAYKIFEATLKGLPDTARIVEATSKLLPMILSAFGYSI